MKRKREEAANLVKTGFASSSILILLPDEYTFIVPDDLATAVDVQSFDKPTKLRREHEPVLANFLTLENHHVAYDFLEFYCFLN
jgi:hypothetical protein